MTGKSKSCSGTELARAQAGTCLLLLPGDVLLPSHLLPPRSRRARSHALGGVRSGAAVLRICKHTAFLRFWGRRAVPDLPESDGSAFPQTSQLRVAPSLLWPTVFSIRCPAGSAALPDTNHSPHRASLFPSRAWDASPTNVTPAVPASSKH